MPSGNFFEVDEVFKDNGHYVGNQKDNLVYGHTKRMNGHSPYPVDALNMALYIGDDDANVHANQHIIANELGIETERWIAPIQTHGNHIAQVTYADAGTNVSSLGDSLNGVDGLYTYDKVLLTMNYADCVPVYIYSEANSFIGLAHAGWRGTSGRITQRLIESYKGDISDLKVVIGPSINMNAYEVDDRVINALRDHGLTEACIKETQTGYLLNLKELNKNQALNAGIDEKNIYVTKLGTEDTSQFFSFRVEGGKTGRAMAFIGRK